MIPLLGTCPGVDAQMFSKGGPQIPRNPQVNFGGSMRFKTFHKSIKTASLVVQWLRICLPIQGTQVRSLVQEDSTCCKATKHVPPQLTMHCSY